MVDTMLRSQHVLTYFSDHHDHTPPNCWLLAEYPDTQALSKVSTLVSMNMSIVETAEYLNVSVNTVRRRLTRGLLTGSKLGGHWVINVETNGSKSTRVDSPEPPAGSELLELLKTQIERKDAQIEALLRGEGELRQLLAQRSLSEPHRRKSAFVSWWAFLAFWRKE